MNEINLNQKMSKIVYQKQIEHRVKLKYCRVVMDPTLFGRNSFYRLQRLFFDNQHCQQFVILENVVFLVTIQSE